MLLNSKSKIVFFGNKYKLHLDMSKQATLGISTYNKNHAYDLINKPVTTHIIQACSTCKDTSNMHDNIYH